MIIDAFKNKMFPLDDPDDFPGYVLEEDILFIGESSSHSEDELNEMIIKKGRIINKELFGKHFNFQSLLDMQITLSKTQSTPGNKELVRVIKSGLIDLDKEIKKMSKDEIENEKPNEIIDAVAEILEFNKNQEGQGLKVFNSTVNA